MAVMLLARLGKDRLRVLCGRIECGATIAHVREQLDGRVVIFPPGWTLDRGGTYRLTQRARRRIARGQQPTYRRAPGTTHYFRPDGTPMAARYAVTPHSYPAQAQCPRCGFIQVLNAARLEVIVEPRVRYPEQTEDGRDYWHAERYMEWAIEQDDPLHINIDPRCDDLVDFQIERWAEQARGK